MSARRISARNSITPSERLAVSMLALAGVAGCSSQSFTPSRSARALGGEVQAVVTRLRVEGIFSPHAVYEVRVQAPPGTKLTAATIAPAVARPCEGVAAKVIEVNDDPGARELSGTRTVSVEFHHESVTEPPIEFLDLATENGEHKGCVRVPVSGATVAYEREPALFISGPLTIEAASASRAGPFSFIGTGIGAGTWFGPVQWRVEGLIGVSGCSEYVCEPSLEQEKKTVSSGFATAGRTEVAIVPFVAKIFQHASYSGFGLGARYTAYYAHVDAREGERWQLVHGLHGVLKWIIGDYSIPDATDDVAEAPSWSFDVPLGIWIHEPGRSPQIGFSGGLGMALTLPQ